MKKEMTPIQQLIHALESMNRIEVSPDLKRAHDLWIAYAKTLLVHERVMRKLDYLKGQEDRERDICNIQYIKDSYGS